MCTGISYVPRASHVRCMCISVHSYIPKHNKLTFLSMTDTYICMHYSENSTRIRLHLTNVPGNYVTNILRRKSSLGMQVKHCYLQEYVTANSKINNLSHMLKGKGNRRDANKPLLKIDHIEDTCR